VTVARILTACSVSGADGQPAPAGNPVSLFWKGPLLPLDAHGHKAR